MRWRPSTLIRTTYPHGLTRLDRLRVSVGGLKLRLRSRTMAIRRVEFDDFLLKRAGVPVHQHHARSITRMDGGYTVDGEFWGRYLVGAGGTQCPVARTLLADANPRTGGFADRDARAGVCLPHRRRRATALRATFGSLRTGCRATPGTCPRRGAMSTWALAAARQSSRLAGIESSGTGTVSWPSWTAWDWCGISPTPQRGTPTICASEGGPSGWGMPSSPAMRPGWLPWIWARGSRRPSRAACAWPRRIATGTEVSYEDLRTLSQPAPIGYLLAAAMR